MKVIPKESYKRALWKNGLGHTDEIAIYPETASLVKGDFLWRLSSARIEQASPFSLFPHHDRVLMVLEGGGVRLFHVFEEGEPADETELPPLEPYEFPGDIQSRCELIDGSITDFSIFVRKGEVSPEYHVQELGGGEEFVWNPTGNWNFVYVIEGDVQANQTGVPRGSTLSVESGTTLTLNSETDAKVFLIGLRT